MYDRWIVLALCCCCYLPLHSQIAYWNGFMGGNAYDIGKSLLLNKDGTLVFGGESFSTDGMGKGNHSENADIIVYKFASQGIIFWKQLLGGSGEESLSELIRTKDGGYALIGTTNSDDGDISKAYGNMDIWVVKLDSEGNVQWQRTYGGTGNDRGKAIAQTADGGFIIGAASGSINGDMRSFHHDGLDSWVAKLDATGDIRWEKHLGGDGNDEVSRVHELSKGNYIVVHSTDSFGGDVSAYFGKKDVWVTALTDYANIDWQRTYGGSSHDQIHTSMIDKDGNLVLGGTSFSTDGIVNFSKGEGDAWLIKLNQQGDLLWTRTYGGSRAEGLNKIQATQDGGFIMTGMTRSIDGDFPENKGFYDAWVIKTDHMGLPQWSRTFGYEGKDGFCDVVEIPAGGFLALGFAEQLPDGTALPGHQGMHDLWVCNFSDPRRKGVKPFVTPALMSGTITDALSGRNLRARISLTDNASLDSLSSTVSRRSTGAYAMTLPTFGLSSLYVQAEGYMPYGENIRADTVRRKTRIFRDFALTPIRIGSSLILENIYFDIGKWDLLPASFAELERLIGFMDLNKRVVIEVSGHTDDTGNKNQKLQLSLNRANAVKEYLIQKGILESRIEVKGLGMARPIGSNATAAGRRKNRRVEFKVINM